MNKNTFLEEIQNYKSEDVFNPYFDTCDLHDHSEAPQIRLDNLNQILDSGLRHRVDSIWVGRDLGYRGGRRTGVALTDEFNLSLASKIWEVNLKKATKSEVYKETTAKMVWDFISHIEERIFTWNVFPFHPHEKNNPFSNRKHHAEERNFGLKLLSAFVNLIKPKKIMAIGHDAYNCSNQLFADIKILKVRHPSYGGIKEFSQCVSKQYDLI